jgi:transposase
VICRRRSGSGTACPDGFGTGSEPTPSGACPTPPRGTPTRSTRRSTAPSSRSTGEAQGGDLAPGQRPIRGGTTTGIVAPTDALGDPVRLAPPPGRRLGTVGVPPLIGGSASGAPVADEAFDGDGTIAGLNERGAGVAIAQHPRRSEPLAVDREMHERRHPIESFFCKLEGLERVALRSGETDESFAGMIHLAAAVTSSRRISTGPSTAVS